MTGRNQATIRPDVRKPACTPVRSDPKTNFHFADGAWMAMSLCGFTKFDTRVVGSTPAEFAALIASERTTWGATFAKFNIRLQ